MRTPGFAAEISLYRSSNQYRANGSYTQGESDVVVPAQNWGDIGNRGCISVGTRGFSARLWNIPWGQSWEQACASTPGAETPVVGMLPTRCINAWGGMWGEWDVPDSTCVARWDNIGDRGCISIRTRGFSARLRDVPPGQTWEDACASTPAPAGTPVAGRLPTRCINAWGGMWGEWDVSDSTCVARWYEIGDRGCACDKGPGVRRHSARLLDVPPGQTWEDACASTPAPAGTAVAGTTPTRCINAWGGMWGEWDIPDRGCCCERCEGCSKAETREICVERDQNGWCIRTKTEISYTYDPCCTRWMECPS